MGFSVEAWRRLVFISGGVVGRWYGRPKVLGLAKPEAFSLSDVGFYVESVG